MVVAIAGPWLCIGGAVYRQEPIVHPITDLIWTGPRPLGSASEQSRLERVFHCLKTAVTSLRTHYTVTLPEVVSQSAPGDGPAGFPFVCEYDGRTFTYEEKLGGDNKAKQVFKVKEGDKFRVVKFAMTYNERAHRLLAEEIDGERFAPALHHVSSCTYGGRRMVVMDYIDGDPTATLSKDHIIQLQAAISRLHKADLVFGDLR